MKKSINELLGMLPEDAMVGRTYGGFKGGFMVCSYYHSAVEVNAHIEGDFEGASYQCPTAYGISIEAALEEAVKLWELKKKGNNEE